MKIIKIKASDIKLRIVKYRWYHRLYDFLKPKNFNKINLDKVYIETNIILNKRGRISIDSRFTGIHITEGKYKFEWIKNNE